MVCRADWADVKIGIDKTMLGFGVVWTRPDVVCEHNLVTLHLGPVIVSLYDGHKRTPVETRPEDMSFR